MENRCYFGVVLLLVPGALLSLISRYKTSLSAAMAKLLFTAVVAGMRNSLAGTVFSANRSGAYVRTKVTPINPQTGDQSLVRNRLASLASNWALLSEAERALWNAATVDYPRTDQFGQTYYMSGLNLYMSLNTNLETAGQNTINEPQPKELFPEYQLVSAVADASGQTFTLTMTDAVPAGWTLIVQATPQVSPGKTFVKNLFRQVDTKAAGSANPQAIGAGYIAKFGALATGYKIGIKTYIINNVSGQASVPTQLTVTVQL